MQLSEKQLSTKSSPDSFDEIYTNFDVSVNETYSAKDGYPFDYPTRWLNDPSMNKRIAIRRLDVIPTTHSFTITIKVAYDESEGISEEVVENGKMDGDYWVKTILVDITEYDNLPKVLNYICNQFKYYTASKKIGGLTYEYSNKDNTLDFVFFDTDTDPLPFCFIDSKENDDVRDFLSFLNQDVSDEVVHSCNTTSLAKSFNNVWNRDRLHFHATFSNSRRQFIGKRGDFYQNLTLLYPPPTNESTFYIRFTSNGIKNILLRYCEFDVQLCFIINYKKATVL